MPRVRVVQRIGNVGHANGRVGIARCELYKRVVIHTQKTERTQLRTGLQVGVHGQLLILDLQ